MNNEIESEFGKGLIICLIKFAEHFMVFEYEKKYPVNNPIWLWANAASDHLYEIEVPPGDEWNEIREKVLSLKEIGLEMGHGYVENNQYHTEEYINKLRHLTREIALLIDKKLGLNPQLGSW